MDGVGRIITSCLHQFVKFQLLLPTMHHPILYHFGYCGHHAAGLVIFAQFAQFRIFFLIIFVFTILPIVGTW
jgi:hypothetical protein